MSQQQLLAIKSRVETDFFDLKDRSHEKNESRASDFSVVSLDHSFTDEISILESPRSTSDDKIQRKPMANRFMRDTESRRNSIPATRQKSSNRIATCGKQVVSHYNSYSFPNLSTMKTCNDNNELVLEKPVTPRTKARKITERHLARVGYDNLNHAYNQLRQENYHKQVNGKKAKITSVMVNYDGQMISSPDNQANQVIDSDAAAAAIVNLYLSQK
jgi:hypothetical protein